MRKFTFSYMILLAVFLIGGIGVLIFSPKDETPEITDKLIDKTPGLSSSLAFEQLLTNQQLKKAIINIQAKQIDKKDTVDLTLAAPQFATEESLLMDSYNILIEANAITALQQVTLTWQNEDKNLLTFTILKSQMEQLNTKSYEEIKLLAESYFMDDTLK